MGILIHTVIEIFVTKTFYDYIRRSTILCCNVVSIVTVLQIPPTKPCKLQPDCRFYIIIFCDNTSEAKYSKITSIILKVE